MGYTYDQFVSAATAQGLMDKFDDNDLQIARNNPEYGLSALKLQKDLQGATTTEQKMLAQESLNQLRKSYGGIAQSSAAPGSSVAGGFDYGRQDAYDKALDKVTAPSSFSYDYEKDPVFQAVKKTQLREADRAERNSMANYAAMTGGMPSTAAVTAAQQAGDYYRSQIPDYIPTLEQTAYQRFLNQYDMDQAALVALQGDRNLNWSQYLDQYDRDQAQKQQDLAAQQFDQQFQWNQYLDNYDRLQAAQQQEQTRKQQEFDNALKMYNLLGYATPEIAAVLGIPMEEKEKETVSETPYSGDYMSGARMDEIYDYVENFMDSVKTKGVGASFDPKRILSGMMKTNTNGQSKGYFNNQAELNFALSVLDSLSRAGYSK